MKMIILGSGSGFAIGDRFNTSIALLTGTDCYMFDCGEPAGALLFRNGIDPLSVRGIFVSHMHLDHIGGLGSVLFSMYLPGRSKNKKFKPWSITRYDDWYRKNLWFPDQVIEETERRELSLYIPEEGIEAITAYLQAGYLVPAVLPFDLKIRPVQIGEFYRNTNLCLTSVPNKHLENNAAYAVLSEAYPQAKRQSYSFKIEAEGNSVVFSGDIDNLEELTPLMEGVKTVIVEVAHHEPEKIKPYFDRFAVERVILTHIHPGLEERLFGLLESWGDTRFKAAHDGLQIDF